MVGPRKQKPRSPKKKQYDYVGHIVFPNIKEIYEIFYEPDPHKVIYTVKKDGEVITSDITSTDFLRYLDGYGYEIESEVVEAPGKNKPRLNLARECDNSKCVCFKDKYHGLCRFKIRSSIENTRERIKGTAKFKVVESNIVVSFTAKDVKELTTKSDCLILYVYNLTNVIGESDTYEKSELC